MTGNAADTGRVSTVRRGGTGWNGVGWGGMGYGMYGMTASSVAMLMRWQERVRSGQVKLHRMFEGQELDSSLITFWGSLESIRAGWLAPLLSLSLSLSAT